MIKLINVSIRLGEFSLENVNLDIRQGEFFSILGPTGTGKSVILEMIAGFYKPDSGKIFLAGRDAAHIPPEKRNLGFVYQDYALFPHLNVYKNIAFGLYMKRIPSLTIKARVKEVAEMLGIVKLLNRYPTTLSGGEQQRIALARALVLRPPVLLMDEPFSALDPNTRKKVYSDLKRLHAKYKFTAVHVTHDFAEAALLADRIGIILNGTVRKVGVPGSIFSNPEDPEIAAFLNINQESADADIEGLTGMNFQQHNVCGAG